MQFRATLETDYGTSATETREDPASYVADVQIRVKVPKPNADMAGLSKLNPQLAIVLPQLPLLLANSTVSPFFDDLYRLKVNSLKQNLLRLDTVLSRHNFFDCETVLNIEHPVTKRRAVLMQADMDTDNDGSDSDRVPDVDGSSATFQPFTSFRWPKKTAQPNSFLQIRAAKLKSVEAEAATPGLPQPRVRQLKEQQADLKSEISDLQKYSCLIGAADPYVVLPGSMLARKYGEYTPAIGDYCVVIYNDVILPSVVGDAGPPTLVGEASLRICRQIDPRADASNRPVNDLKATYLIFPGSADKPFDAPNLAHWRDRCEKLLNDLGGCQGQLLAWEDVTKPKPPPAAPAPATPLPSTPHPQAGSALPGTPLPATPPPAATPKPAQ